MTGEALVGWSWFDGQEDAAGEVAVRNAFVRTFNSDAGRQVLMHLRQMTIERRSLPGATDSALWHLEGQRYICQLVERLANAETEEAD